METWKPITGYEGLYSVSTLGKVKRDSGYIRSGEFMRSNVARPDGRMSVSLSKNDRKRIFLVHRLVAGSFIGECPSGKEVNHKDGNPSNNRIENLEYVSSSENKAHAYRTGLRSAYPNYGEKNGSHKLTEAKVLEIRNLYSEGGQSYKGLARRFGVSGTLISNIVRRTAWRKI